VVDAAYQFGDNAVSSLFERAAHVLMMFGYSVFKKLAD